jgi:hypothetical protein
MGATRVLVLCAGLWATAAAAGAQPAAVWAGANDTPNQLITGVFDGTMSYLPEIPSGGASGSGAGFFEAQVRVFAGKAQGRCSLVAQTNGQSGSVAVYTVDATGAATHVAGSPFATGGVSTTLAWARDGGALYVSTSVSGAAIVATLRVTCTPGGPVSVTNAGPVTLTGVSSLRDMDVSASGNHLCVTGDASNNVGCFALDPTTRLPASAAVNLVTLASTRGLRLAANGCGVVGVPTLNQVRGVFVPSTGTLGVTNSATHVAPPFHGAVSPDGSFAAYGSTGSSRQAALYTITAGSCLVTLAGTTPALPGGLAPYVAFDGANRLYLADVQANQIRVFQATAAGPGAAVSTSTTNHPTANPPIGIDAALLSAVPVELVGFGVE